MNLGLFIAATEISARTVAIILLSVGIGLSVIAALVVWWKRRH